MPLNEREAIINELNPPFIVSEPVEQTSPLVFCSPHSGRVYPRILLDKTRLDPLSLRKSEDCFVDELFECAPIAGSPLITARFPRAYLDVNREPFELDPELFDEALPPYANAKTMRVIGGLGTIPRVVAEAEEIYSGPLSIAVAMERIERLYRPFHDALDRLLQRTRAKFGYAVLVDCHSMPSASVTFPASVRPEFILGDRFGGSCDFRVTRAAREAINRLKYQVQLNRPYAGGFITEHYGRPSEDMHALQVEINRGLYLNEQTLKQNRHFAEFKADITALVFDLTISIPAILEGRLAAE
ncbi:MAG: N-formylglutamate amidohydrolase [Alphaproteobacteria bacterium]|nr:N-formylglutamate amidohydrolase [Alphaproteobacteria bacterium]